MQALHQFLRLALHVEAGILLGLVPRHGRNPLHEIEDAGRGMAFLRQYTLDDLRSLRPGESTLAQEIAAIFVGTGDNAFACGPDAFDKGTGRRIGEAGEGRGGLVGEARSGIFAVTDRDLLEILNAPQIAVLANGPQVETR